MSYRAFAIKAEDKFWERISINENDCWLWLGKLNDSGYGRLNVNGKDVRIHRFAYELYKGKIPDGLVLDHLCRVRHCANPDHLEAVTKGENTRRGNAPEKVKKHHQSKTHCPQGHPFTKENTQLSTQKNGKYPHRKCRACNRAYKLRVRNQKVRR